VIKRVNLAMLAGPALIALTVLAACSGGGTGATHGALPTGAAPTSTPVQTASSGAHLVITINRTPKTRKRANASAKRTGAAAKRSPKFIGDAAQGLQIAVSTTGGTPVTQTVYADVSTTSPLCTTGGSGNNTYTATCTIPIPTVGASESIIATEVDATPATPVVNGMGTGFPNTSNILAVGTTTLTGAVGTTTNVSLGLSPVAAAWYDCGSLAISGNSADDDFYPNMGKGRIVVTAGTPATFVLQPEFEDVDYDYLDDDATPLPFVDVNGSPAPIVVTASSTHVGADPFYNTNYSNAAESWPQNPVYSQSTTIPNDGYEWFDCLFDVGAEYDGQTTATSTITLDQSLTAIPQFTGGRVGDASYETAFGPSVYTIVPLSATPATVTVGVTAGTTATVTGSDDEGTGGMIASTCSGTGSATITSTGAIDTTSWTQGFTVTPVVAGSCTFTLLDENLILQHGSSVPSNTVTVTINP
jgi:hypothetical protein